jgi:hypothetical protein
VRYGRQRRTHKYGAKKVIVTEDGTMFEVEQLKQYNITDITGIQFDSKAEAEYYLILKDRLAAKEIAGFSRQNTYVLQEKPKIVYKPDFVLVNWDGSVNVIDVKGVQTAAFRLKVRMFKAKYPHLPLILAKKQGRKFVEIPA